MANRNIQAKIVKLRRRGRFAVFSGSTTRLVREKVEQRLEHVNDDTTRVVDVIIPVGKISLSRHVINTGRGPDPERMQEYYGRVSARSYSSELPPTKGMTQPIKDKARHILQDALARLRGALDERNRVMLVDNHNGMLMLCFASEGKQWFFIDVDYKSQTFRRSRDYTKKETAIERLKNKRVSWIERVTLSEVMATPKV